MATISGDKLNNILTGSVNDDIIHGLNGNDYLIGSDGDDRLYGDNGQDVLKGGDGFDVLDGGKGADIMAGGTLSDSYYVDNSNDTVVESFDSGLFDIVISEINYILPTNVEDLTLVGTRSFKGTGNELSNFITGNSLKNTLSGLDGADLLDGGKGADVMIGGKGADTYYVDNAKDSITEEDGEGSDTVITDISYTLPNHVESLDLRGSANLKGFGNNLDNSLSGNEGNNTLSGGLGDDDLQGFAGNDLLIGGLGDDFLDGGAGKNILRGGEGDDIYFVDSKDNVVVESTAIANGIDTVVSIINYTLANGFENLDLSLSLNDMQGSGNHLDNKIDGGLGNDILRGLNGNDTLNGQEGNDRLLGGDGNDLLISNNFFFIDETDLLSGGNGNDTLVCVLDHFNRLIGGAGQDTFSFDINRFTTATGQLTEISDFRSGLDVIDLGSIAVSSGHFLSFIGNDAFSSSNASGQVRFDVASHQLLGSTDRDVDPEFAISLLGVNSLSPEDIIIK